LVVKVAQYQYARSGFPARADTSNDAKIGPRVSHASSVVSVCFEETDRVRHLACRVVSDTILADPRWDRRASLFGFVRFTLIFHQFSANVRDITLYFGNAKKHVGQLVDQTIDTVGDAENGDAGDERHHREGFLVRHTNDATYTVLQVIRPALLVSLMSLPSASL